MIRVVKYDLDFFFCSFPNSLLLEASVYLSQFLPYSFLFLGNSFFQTTASGCLLSSLQICIPVHVYLTLQFHAYSSQLCQSVLPQITLLTCFPLDSWEDTEENPLGCSRGHYFFLYCIMNALPTASSPVLSSRVHQSK